MSDERPAHWPRYLRSAARLRVAIERNLQDYLFERDLGGRIFYVFDANVIKLFLSPAEVSERVASLGERGDEPHLPATAVITAEFLFSRGLSGQYDTPALLTPGHAEDVAAMIDRIERRVVDVVHRQGMDGGGQRLGRGGADAIHLQRLVDSVSFEGGDIEGPVRRLVQELPKAAHGLFDSAVNEARQVGRIVDGDLLRPLRLHPAATREVMNPDLRIVEVWAARIRAEHREAIGGDRQASARERIRRDAEAVAQTLILNDAARDALVPTRYVFVTTDKAIRRAYARRFWEEGPDRPSDYALRDPAQYVPILNAQQMRNGVDSSDLLEQVRTAIDALFEGVRDDLGNADYDTFMAQYADGWMDRVRARRPAAWGRALDRLDAVRRDGRSEALENLHALWREAGQGAVLLNAKLLHRRFEVEFTPVVRVLNTYSSIQSRVLSHLRTVVSDLGDAHANLVATGLEREDAPPSTADGVVIAPKVPGPVPLLVRRPLRSLRDEEPGRPSDRTRPTIFFDAACAAFRAGRWALAQGYARRAHVVFRAAPSDIRVPLNPDELEAYAAEAAYVSAAATILRMESEEAYDLARRGNAEAVRRHRLRSDRYGLIRGIATESALVLGRLYRGRLQAHLMGWWSTHDPLLAFLRMSDGLLEAVEALPMASAPSPGYVRPDGDGSALRSFLWQQVAFASAFERLFMRDEPVFDDALVARAIEAMAGGIGVYHDSLASRMVTSFLRNRMAERRNDDSATHTRADVERIASQVQPSDTIEAALAKHLLAWVRDDSTG
ncbi:hypothetical protein ACFZ8E_03975 [Methylobacterium sp. HMF5984]|uniref:hypothetical protein n=1 Tax=Methylobacterium sp. HMF5984 TaxID=3367370 RepID=UPI003853CB44